MHYTSYGSSLCFTKTEGSTASKQLLGKAYKCLENILRNLPLFIDCKQIPTPDTAVIWSELT